MPTLNIRNVPEGLYRRLQALAEGERRSMSAEVVVLLQDSVSRNGSRFEKMTAILDRIRARREAIRLPKGWPGANALLREDRSR